jgi:Protein of unknown function (DUF2568)
MKIAIAINAACAFGLELCMLAAYGYWGFRLSQTAWVAWLCGLVAPLIATLFWALFAAPRSATRLTLPWLVLFEWAMFALAAGALHASGRTRLATGLLLAATVNLALAGYWHMF